MRTTLNLGKIDYNGSGRKNCRVTLEIEIRTKAPDVAPYLDTDLKPLNGNVTELSICGNIWNPRDTDCYSCGQNADEIRNYFKGSKRVQRLCEIWDRYHLNGMNAGTRLQSEALKDCQTTDYTKRCEYLAGKGLLEVPIPEESRTNFEFQRNKAGQLPTMYRFGSAWLHESVPAEVLAEVRQIIESFKPTAANVA